MIKWIHKYWTCCKLALVVMRAFEGVAHETRAQLWVEFCGLRSRLALLDAKERARYEELEFTVHNCPGFNDIEMNFEGWVLRRGVERIEDQLKKVK